MSLQRVSAAEVMATMTSGKPYSTIIDARSEAEFAHDHLPKSVNWPSLNDEQRHIIGTMFKQQGGFEAQKIGAAWVATNIAAHIEREVLQKPKAWKPLVYCWRGGKRSGALAMVLGQIGFQVSVLDGGYKAFRASMLAWLDERIHDFRFSVVCGTTGSGKTRLLQTLAQCGAQVLDLEAMACHRSSVLGHIPGVEQPSQKHFDMRVWEALTQMDPQRVIFVEAESRKVGNVAVIDSLVNAMRVSPCINLEMSLSSRIELLLEDYPFFVANTQLFCDRLEALVGLKGKVVVENWKTQALSGQLPEVVESLLVTHYDPNYLKSIERNFSQYEKARPLLATDHKPASFKSMALELINEMDPALKND